MSRKLAREPFDERFLWNIICQIGAGLKYLYSGETIQPHEDIRPQQIQVVDENCFLIYDNSVLKKEGTNQFTIVKEGNKEACYLAPEIFQSMNAKIDLDEYDKGKADVYSLGLTVLSAACQESMVQLYNFKNCKINQNKLENKLIKVGRMYSTKFYLMLKAMTMPSVKNRLSPQKLDEIVWDA